MGVNPTIAWNAAYISGTNKIQLRQKFTLTVHDTIDIKLIEPTFTSPLVISIPIEKEIYRHQSGLLEVGVLNGKKKRRD